MGETADTAKADINAIPYDAPLSIEEPSFNWVMAQYRKGLNSTRASVPDVDLSGKWVIISGANNGIGREAAIQFAKWRANIVLACRDPPPKEIHPKVVAEECRNAARKAGQIDTEIEWWELDCSKLSSVEAFAKRWLDTDRALDILCNNAGIGRSPGGSAVFKTQDGFEIIHQVNFLSHVLLTLYLLPSLAKALTPRIVCTTSSAYYIGRFDLRNFNGELGKSGTFYQNNKLWFQVWLTELQRRMLLTKEYKHITVNGVHPGCVNSGIWNPDNVSWMTPVRTAIIKVFAYFMSIDPQQGSLSILHAATSVDAAPDPKVQGVGTQGGRGGGRYFNRIWEETPMPHTKDPDCRQRVWRKVNDELKLQDKGLLGVLGLRYVDEPVMASLQAA
jgi:NAD(P)-dependent dehydrogenase (short-subunit alcohol dehydrogenase family)